MAQAQLVVHVWVLASHVGHDHACLPNFVPDVLDDRFGAVNFIGAQGIKPSFGRGGLDNFLIITVEGRPKRHENEAKFSGQSWVCIPFGGAQSGSAATASENTSKVIHFL